MQIWFKVFYLMHEILLCLVLDLGYLKYWNLEAFVVITKISSRIDKGCNLIPMIKNNFDSMNDLMYNILVFGILITKIN